ncbi:MAG: hypothetical protein KGL39_13695 [Patescibacteria group bacterium]|nr:hypothetical protein [Patescibacteria group bacterium]
MNRPSTDDKHHGQGKRAKANLEKLDDMEMGKRVRAVLEKFARRDAKSAERILWRNRVRVERALMQRCGRKLLGMNAGDKLRMLRLTHWEARYGVSLDDIVAELSRVWSQQFQSQGKIGFGARIATVAGAKSRDIVRRLPKRELGGDDWVDGGFGGLSGGEDCERIMHRYWLVTMKRRNGYEKTLNDLNKAFRGGESWNENLDDSQTDASRTTRERTTSGQTARKRNEPTI